MLEGLAWIVVIWFFICFAIECVKGIFRIIKFLILLFPSILFVWFLAMILL